MRGLGIYRGMLGIVRRLWGDMRRRLGGGRKRWRRGRRRLSGGSERVAELKQVIDEREQALDQRGSELENVLSGLKSSRKKWKRVLLDLVVSPRPLRHLVRIHGPLLFFGRRGSYLVLVDIGVRAVVLKVL
ncbi:hypothetical protein K443DRAFT_502696 [Laccaria amethystina LaAM-08-1]|uniref:Uncharacterized protein n=1 Tax=Laccaria amethystina LaAM-08-1 TaxID=1095629 RepID=A0A0C9XDR3_9AGAR|nr:hypothetical protein K443DRAFT_502696 [Laccaria amethystina LaAM-08-1]